MARIVLSTFGSVGDLHPFVAIGKGLQARGHEVVIAAPPVHGPRVERHGLAFMPVRPDTAFIDDGDQLRRFMHAAGIVSFVRDVYFQALPEAYADTLAAVDRADLLVSHPVSSYVARLVAEKTGIGWVSTHIVPLGFFSVHDLSVFPLAPAASKALRPLGPWFWGPAFAIGKRLTRSIAEPWERFREEIGLPRSTDVNPLVSCDSPSLVLATFSPLLADRQPDWPPQTKIVGYPMLDDVTPLPPALEEFLDAGEPPIAFTLGTAVVAVGNDFYRESALAAKLLGRRAVLVVGKQTANRPHDLGPDMLAVEYAPFAQLFRRSAAVVHHGGIGTTHLALQAAVPALIVPHAWDQPDNAARAARLGVARVLSPHRYVAKRVAAELRKLLDQPSYGHRAKEVAAIIKEENGVAAACDAIEAELSR